MRQENAPVLLFSTVSGIYETAVTPVDCGPRNIIL